MWKLAECHRIFDTFRNSNASLKKKTVDASEWVQNSVSVAHGNRRLEHLYGPILGIRRYVLHRDGDILTPFY